MSLQSEKMIGQQILVNIDQLIEVVIATGLKSQQDSQQLYDEGCQLVAGIYALLEQIIGPQSEYLSTAVKELVAQRIPEQRLLNGFSDFYTLLDGMCQRVVTAWPSAQYSPDQQPGLENRGRQNKVERALELLFPHETILKKHRYNGMYFEYFMPSLKIAVEEIRYYKDKDRALKDFLCRKYGIKIISVDNNIPGYREIARHIKRQLAV